MPGISITKIEKTNGMLIVVGLVSLLIVFLPTVKSLFVVWLSESSHYSHGILLVFVLVYILHKEWQIKGQYLHVSYRLSALAIIIVLSFIWLFAQLSQVQVVTQIAFILIMALFIVGLFGYRQIGMLLFPILLFFTAVPVWSIFSEPLQYPTAITVDKMLHLTGYISFREGYFINIPEGIIEVSNVCSGLNNQIAAITLSLLCAYYYRLRLGGMLILTLLGIVVAFISNSIRIYIVVLAGHYTQMQHNLMDDHVWLGWLVFSIIFFLLLFLINIGMRQKRAVSVVVKQEPNKTNGRDSNSKSILAALFLITAAAVGPALSMGYNVLNKSKQDVSFSLPDTINEWTKQKSIVNNWKPVWLGADVELLKRYENNSGERVDLYLSYYSIQEQGKEAANSENIVFDKEEWRILGAAQITEYDKDKNKINMKEIIIQNDVGRKRILRQWYYVGGQRVVGDIYAKFYGLLGVLNGRTDAAVIIVSSEVEQDYSETRERMSQFTGGMIISIENILSNP